METWGLVAFLTLAGLAVVHSLVLSLQTWEHRRYVRNCMRGLGRHDPAGHAAVFVPCKGIDVSLEGNLRALLCQDYPDYDVTFIVESADDPACEVIQRLMAQGPAVASRLIIAGEATRSGQKVHNLRAATARLSPHVEYLAFLDSDARPRREWLSELIGNLNKPNVDAVTGYRWFSPARPSAANHLLYGINCDVMSLLDRNSHHFVWGGSWGIRREAFDSGGLHELWKGTLSDDLVAGRMLRDAGRAVRFVPGCVVASPLNCTMPQMFEFIRRQYLVGKMYARRWWTFALLATTFTNLAWWASLAVLACGVVVGVPPVWIPAAVCATLYLLSVHRGLVRQDLVHTYFPDHQPALRKAGRLDVWASPLVGLVNWLGVFGSMFGWQITWRGIRYHVSPGGRIRAIQRQERPLHVFEAWREEHTQDDGPEREFIPYKRAG